LAKERGAAKVKCTQYGQRNIVAGMLKEDKERILCPECETEEKQPWWD